MDHQRHKDRTDMDRHLIEVGLVSRLKGRTDHGARAQRRFTEKEDRLWAKREAKRKNK